MSKKVIIYVQIDDMRRHPCFESHREYGSGLEITKRLVNGHAEMRVISEAVLLCCSVPS